MLQFKVKNLKICKYFFNCTEINFQKRKRVKIICKIYIFANHNNVKTNYKYCHFVNCIINIINLSMTQTIRIRIYKAVTVEVLMFCKICKARYDFATYTTVYIHVHQSN